MKPIAMDPSTSGAQHRAMEAAAHGHSTLGIPKSVGAEFSKADKGKSFDAAPVRGAGIMMVTPDGRALFIRRTKDNEDGEGEWDFPGGRTDGDETPDETAKRETLEEIGGLPYGERTLAYSHKRKDGFVFDLFRQPILRTFKPKLSPEHDMYVWAPLDRPPQPLLPAIDDNWDTVTKDCALAKDAGEFEESKHPRAENGEFGSGSGGATAGGGASAKGARPSILTAAPADRAAWPKHIQALKVPPAWTDVRISTDPKADLLVVGKDAKGRRQPIYSDTHNMKAAAVKFARLQELDKKFTKIEKQNTANQASKDQSTKDHADCMALIMKLGVRPGSEEEHGGAVKAYGATTLEGQHVVTEGGKTSLRFVGKKGVALDLPVDDPSLAAMLKQKAAKAGLNGQLFSSVSSASLLKYSHGFDGGGFKTKDFRTLLATHTALDAVKAVPAPVNEKEYKKAVKQVATVVSQRLGNTPTVALQSYINPTVFAGWRSGATASVAKDAVVVMDDNDLPDAHFGAADAPLPNWRDADQETPDDDEELAKTPEDVINMLGFDPLEADTQAHDSMAFDRATVRTVDQDGRMHVELTNISKAAVNPYKGSEIPNGELLGLDPNKIYYLLRDPEELVKAAPTFNNLPLLNEHVPVHVDDPQQELVVGSTGTDAVFEAPYLKNSLVIWTKDAITGVESGEQQEISCAYHYVADMTPGIYEGQSYDGVMREIRGNHVALVAAGRAGPDVVVGDSVVPINKERITMVQKALSKKAVMAKGALLAILSPKLAADAMPDLSTLLAGVKRSNWLDKKPGIVAALKPLLAKDADLADVVQLLDKLDGEDPNDDDVATDSPLDAILEKLRGKVDDQTLAEVQSMIEGMSGGGAQDADEDEAKKKAAEEAAKKKEAEDKAKMAGDDPDGNKDTPKPPDKAAMDAAIAKAVKEERAAAKIATDAAIKVASETATKNALKLAQDISAAEEAVKPYVGKLALAFDSENGVYKAALEALGVKIEGVHPSAYKAILEAQPRPGITRPHIIAKDGVVAEGFDKRFPDAERLLES